MFTDSLRLYTGIPQTTGKKPRESENPPDRANFFGGAGLPGLSKNGNGEKARQKAGGRMCLTPCGPAAWRPHITGISPPAARTSPSDKRPEAPHAAGSVRE